MDDYDEQKEAAIYRIAERLAISWEEAVGDAAEFAMYFPEIQEEAHRLYALGVLQ